MPTPPKTPSLCRGCRDDVPEHRGENGLCHSYAGARFVVAIEVSISQPPPYNAEYAEPMLNCFRRPGFVKISPSVLVPSGPKKGYWKS